MSILGSQIETPSLYARIENALHGAYENVSSKIPEDFVFELLNGDLTQAGLIKKAKGFSEFGTGLDDSLVRDLTFFKSTTAINEEQLLAVANGKLWRKTFAGSWTSFKSGLTNEHTRIIIGNYKAFFTQPSENVRYWDGATLTETFGNTNTDPPRARHGLWILGWLLLANDDTNPDGIYYGTNGSPTAGWNRTTNVLKIDQGEGGSILGLIPWTDFDFIVLKSTRLFLVSITTTDPATWTVKALTSDIGCVGGAAVTVGDICLFLAEDGIRAVRITDNNIKLTEKSPLTRGRLDTTFARILQSSAVNVATASHWNGVIRFAVPFGVATVNNAMIEYNLALDALSTREGFGFGRFTKSRYSQVTRIHASDETNGKVYTLEDTFNLAGSAQTWRVQTKAMDFGAPAQWKIGGEIELVFNATGDYDVLVEVQLDQGGYQTLGTVNVEGEGPTLPINLPFFLAEDLVRSKLSLAGLGRFREIQFQFSTSDLGAEVEFVRAIVRSLPMEYSKAR